jgi:hypothetical protein
VDPRRRDEDADRPQARPRGALDATAGDPVVHRRRLPPEAFGFYPTDHGGSGTILQVTDRSMLFGDASTTKAWAHDPRVELHGPGYSKVILGEDAASDWVPHVELIASSIAANGGRSCINAPGVWTPKNADAIAHELAQRLARVQALPADHPDASIAAFANPAMAERMNAMIDGALQTPGAVDLTEQIRGTPRLVKQGRVAWLLPRSSAASATTRWPTRSSSSRSPPSSSARKARSPTRSAPRSSAPSSRATGTSSATR